MVENFNAVERKKNDQNGYVISLRFLTVTLVKKNERMKYPLPDFYWRKRPSVAIGLPTAMLACASPFIGSIKMSELQICRIKG